MGGGLAPGMAVETAGRGRPHMGAAGIKELARGIRASARRWPAQARQLGLGPSTPGAQAPTTPSRAVRIAGRRRRRLPPAIRGCRVQKVVTLGCQA